jgi:hypothetical protein
MTAAVEAQPEAAVPRPAGRFGRIRGDRGAMAEMREAINVREWDLRRT